MKKQAVIFDMDGVVSDTQKFHAEAESAILKGFGVDISPEAITARFSGVADDVMFLEIFNEHGVGEYPPIDEIVQRKWDMMAEIATGRITAIPHAVELIKELKASGLKLAIASASTHLFIDEVLTELHLVEFFDSVVSAQEVEYGKPAPDVFLLAASNLDVAPERCIVIEDGRSGMIGAAAANMPCIGLVANTIDDYPATIKVDSLSKVTTELVHSM